MKKHKSPSDLNTRLLRANVDTYLIVKGLSRQLNIPMADALDKLIIGSKPKPKPTPTPIVKPIVVATMPAISIKPAGTFRIRSEPTMVTNGHKVGVLVIKTKGGVISE